MWYRFLPRRLDTQVALACAVILLCTIPLYVTHQAKEELDYIFEVTEHETKVLAENIAVNSVEHIVTRDYSSLENLLLRSARFPGVIDIQVVDEWGKVISDVVSDNDKNADARPRYSIPVIDVPSEVELKMVTSEDKIIIWAPIESGSHLGWVKTNHSLLEARQHKTERITDYLFDGALLTLLLSLLMILSMKKPLRMIRTAVDFASHLDEKTGEQLPVSRHSVEIEKLFEVLNNVSLSLAEQDTVIHQVLKELETQKHALDEHSIVSIWDTDGIITYANDKLTDLTGFSREELCGNKCLILSSDCYTRKKDRTLYENIWSRISAGHIWHGEMCFRTKHGGEAWLNTTIVPFVDNSGKPYEYVNIQTDITEQKHAERELEEKNTSLKELTDNLEAKVIQRTIELEKANEQLQHLNSVKSEFVSVVSHELRTPLTSIKSFAEILEDDFDEIDPDTRRHYLSIINKESVRLGNLINDVLDLQKIDSGKMTWNIEKTDLKKLASTTIELFSKSYQDKGLRLRLEVADEELFADVDSDKIKQVLSNLLSNAYKFTDRGCVSLELKKTVQHPTTLIVDDDKVSCKYLEKLLQKMGVEVISCHQPEQALEILQSKSRKIDLLITDIVMPGMNGIQLIDSIRTFNTKLPIIVVSFSEDDTVLKPLFNYNVTAFLEKPFQPASIIKSIEKIFGDIKNADKNKQMVEISVVDTGSGIPENELDKVFDRFHQVDSSETREKGGSGLGLSICQDIIEYHGGRLWVTSTLGEGSRFSFNLPLLERNNKRIGEILVDAGVATQKDIERALLNQK